MMDWLPDATKSNAKKGAQHDQGSNIALVRPAARRQRRAAFSYTRYSSRDRAGMEPGTVILKHRSRKILDGPSRAAARAMLRGTGYSAEDLRKPIIGVANTWIGPCPAI